MDETVRILLDLQSGNNIFPYVMQKVDFFRGSYLAFVFAGDGVKALQEAGVAGATPVPGLPVIDFLGIYPTWETLLPQFILLAAAALGVICQRRQVPAGRSGHTPPANP
ncbi:hypothetical protein MOTE_03630 [Moorella thermoacetica]|uniref:Uncharacterized protein n=1 Tax=Neomoorella thermoacetica TaxID=1525 RepID=A0A1J5NZX2_NEOTH|nr:hypothetical protein MOTE_03630 [Moorella thermoacetica]